ncbi:MAG: hypothetical protein LBU87_06735 [Lactobacillales bacterium]|jgi:hypothetical protein|nr:hypothetical protein [Lactobacillales bacterium]
MSKRNLTLASATLVLMGFGVFSFYPAVSFSAPIASAEIAQGDGDPSEDGAKNIDLEIANLLADETDKTADDAIATITAEGDFVIPTYLLPVDPVTPTPVSKTAKATALLKDDAIKQTQAQTKSQLQTQATIDNLLAATKEPAPQTSKIAPRNLGTGNRKTNVAAVQKPLLIPLAPVSEIQKDTDGVLEAHQRHVIPSDYADRMLETLNQGGQAPFIMPQEVKVTFYPNATEFSGQTLKWIKAFSKAALTDPRLVVEVRMSTTNPEIQSKRLLLVKNTLLSYGLSTHQIQVAYTKRPKDTLVLRNISKPENTETIVQKTKAGRKTTQKTKKW